MKTILYPLAVFSAITLLASCNKEQSHCSGAVGLAKGQSVVTVHVGASPGTKALGIADDASDTKKVNSIQVFAFDSDGVLQAYESNTSGSSVSLKLNIGQEYTFWAVVNNYGKTGWKYNAVSAVRSQEDFLSIMTDLKDNGKNDLLMFSQSGTEKLIDAATNSLSIEVSRLVSKIQIRKITADFGSNTALKSRSFMIDSIYVINAVRGESLWFSPESSPAYYNRRKYISGAADLLLCDRLGTSFELSTSAGVANPYTTAHTFFTYGNATQLPTRLVISCRWGDRRTFYPVDIKGTDGYLSPNCSYIVNQLTIKGLGSDDPNVIPERQEFSAAVTIKDWGTGFEKDITL